jgi:hypothetical protein
MRDDYEYRHEVRSDEGDEEVADLQDYLPYNYLELEESERWGCLSQAVIDRDVDIEMLQRWEARLLW